MPLRRVKSRVLFQNLTKKPKKDIYHSARGKSTRIAIGGAPERVLTMSPVRKEPEYPKIRVPSKDELQDLHSKMSATIAAAKARGAQQRSCNAPSPPSRLHLERLPDEMQNSKVAFTEPTASASVSERVPATSTPATRKGTAYEDDDEPSASLLATTAVYRPIEYPIAPAILDGQAADGPHDTPSVDATDVAAIRGIEHDGPAKQVRRVTFAEMVVCSPKPPVCPREHLSTFTKRVLTLFVGRCRCCDHNIKLPGDAPEPAREQTDVVTPDASQTQPHEEPGQATPGIPRRRLQRRQTKAQFGGVTPSLPIPRQKHPHATPGHAPLQRTSLPISNGCKEQPETNPYQGYYKVAPDVFQPVEIQVGFSSTTPPRAAPTSPKREQVLEEPTVLEMWDAHAARFAEYREAPAVPDDSRELARHQDALEDVRAERLRYGTGHCFGALAGDVYLFYGGLIF